MMQFTHIPSHMVISVKGAQKSRELKVREAAEAALLCVWYDSRPTGSGAATVLYLRQTKEMGFMAAFCGRGMEVKYGEAWSAVPA